MANLRRSVLKALYTRRQVRLVFVALDLRAIQGRLLAFFMYYFMFFDVLVAARRLVAVYLRRIWQVLRTLVKYKAVVGTAALLSGLVLWLLVWLLALFLTQDVWNVVKMYRQN